MKTLLLFFGFCMLSISSRAQESHIETESVAIDNLISFIVNKIEPLQERETVSNYIFLLQTSNSGISNEDKVILKHAFKLLSERITSNDFVSILTYSGFSGIAMEKTSGDDVKTMIYTIEHLEASVNKTQEDGIQAAYKFATDHYEKEANNVLVMVRNPQMVHTKHSVTDKEQPKQKNNAVLVTAIALLPEIISLIKD